MPVQKSGNLLNAPRIYIYISSSSSRGITSDIPDPLLPPLPIVHRFRPVLRATPRILTELQYVDSSWSPYFCTTKWRVHRSTSLMSSSLASPAMSCMSCSSNLDSFRDGGRWPYSYCFVGCCLQDMSNIACSIPVLLPTDFFSSCLVSVHVVHPYSSIDTIAAWKKLRFILSVNSDFHMTDSLLIAAHAFVSRVSMPVSVDETLLPK